MSISGKKRSKKAVIKFFNHFHYFLLPLRKIFMEIQVRKPTDREIAAMKTKPVWTCEVSEFYWNYDDMETCLLIEGDVTVNYGSKSVSFAAGDLVVFPKGLSCVWQVKKPVRKYYTFN